MYALGFIETKGLVGAIEAADAMLKAADVFLVEKNQVGSGLVTITVAGEVSAVQASVEAAAVALNRIDGAKLVSKHVIARHYDELSRIIGTGSPVPAAEEVAPQAEVPAPAAADKAADESVESTSVIEEVSASETAESVAEVQVEKTEGETALEPASAPAVEKEGAAEDGAQYKISQLKKMKIGRVRQIARSLSGISLTPDEVKKAPKKALIEAILNVTRQIEE